MATTTLANFIQQMSEEIGDYLSLLASSNGTTTTIIDTSLANLVGGGDDDFCLGWYVKITETGHASVGAAPRRISSYAASTNTITWLEPNAALLANGEAYELHRYDPTDKALAVNQAIERLAEDLYVPIRDETIVIDDRLSNSDFETFSGGFTGWTEVGSPTVTAETIIKLHGAQSAKVVASGADGQLTQTVATEVHEITSKSVTYRKWVATDAVNAARIRLDWDGSDIDSSVYHSGAGVTNAIQWEQLTITAQVPSTATQIKAVCEVADGNTAYFDAGYLYHVPIHRYTIPAFITSLAHVTEQVDENLLDGPYLPYGWGNQPRPGHRLRIEGKGVLSTMSSDTATTEIGVPQSRLLIMYALHRLFSILSSPARSSAQQSERYKEQAQMWLDSYNSFRQSPTLKMKRLGRTKMTDVAHIERDVNGTYLVFDQLGRTAGPLAGSVRI